jgi:hypothetical protein
MASPCGLPVLSSDHLPSSVTSAFSHFWISRSILGPATRCSMNLTIQLLSRLSQTPRMSASKMWITLCFRIAYDDASRASLRPGPGQNPFKEPENIPFTNLVKDGGPRRTGRFCPPRPRLPMDVVPHLLSLCTLFSTAALDMLRDEQAVEIDHPIFKSGLILLPCGPVYSGCGFPLQ